MEKLAKKSQQKQEASIEQIGSRISALLTPQQQEKLAGLKKELSEKAERVRKEQLAKLENKKPEDEKKPEDYEFLKSWKPGDPIPERAVPPPPPRRGGFPR
jgi:glutamyl-tRNA reductase